MIDSTTAVVVSTHAFNVMGWLVFALMVGVVIAYAIQRVTK